MARAMSEARDLAMILDAKIPIVVIESPDEKRVLNLLLGIAIKRGVAFYEWSTTRGLRRSGFGEGLAYRIQSSTGQEQHNGTTEITYGEPEALLCHIAGTPGPAIYTLCDFHPYLKGEPKNVRFLKDIALDFDSLGNTLILVSHSVDIPPELSRITASVNLRLPSDEELHAMVRQNAKEWAQINRGKRVRTDNETLNHLIANLRGVSHADARMLIRHAIFADGAITQDDIPELNKLKFELLGSEGVLQFEHDTGRFSDIAGLHNLKEWLTLRRDIFLGKVQAEHGRKSLDRPKGVLLLGVQGSGKSLAAKAVAGTWGVPLLRLDFGTLYNKYFGETERNLRNSLTQASMMAPCVLWMDEIEKGIATDGSDNATSKRVLGTLLTWMAENTSPVFLVATSNDISQLPPELIRKGRLDEVFFVDLPDSETRGEIFRIHLRKRQLDPESFDILQLVEASQGFTGAEIEESIVSARYLSATRRDKATTEDVKNALDRTYPVSVLRAESIEALRDWAEGRTVPA